jgi:Zn-dependent peptidase ImmA (M78 family)
LDIKATVEALIKTHETTCPFQIAKNLKIRLVYEDLGEVMGYFSKDFKFKFIHINKNLNQTERTLVCAHELGHAILHPDINTSFLKRKTFFSIGKIERQANTFLVELLLSDGYIKEDVKYCDYNIYTLAKMAGIPEKLVELKGKLKLL